MDSILSTLNFGGTSSNAKSLSHTTRNDGVEHIIPSLEELNEVPLSQYKCDLCSTVVRTKANLKAHRIKKHKIVESAMDVAFYSKKKSSVAKMFHCPFSECKHSFEYGGGFSKFSHLKQHYQWGHMEKLFTCSICTRSFPTETILNCHVQTCGQSNVCPVCQRSYKERKNLICHQKRAKHGLLEVTSKIIKTIDPQIQYSAQTNGGQTTTQNYTQNIGPTITSLDCDSQSVAPTTQILQPIYVPLMLPISSNNQHSTASFLSALSTLIGQLGANQNCAVGSQSHAQNDLNNVSINAVPEQIGAQMQSSMFTQDSETQTDSVYYMPSPPHTRSVALDLPYVEANMPSIGVSTDLSLGLDEFDIAFDLNMSSFLGSGTSVPSQQQMMRTPSFSNYNQLSTTAMQTEEERLLFTHPDSHVETQTFPQLSYEDMGVGGHLCLQDFTDIETQTVDLESLFMLNSVETQTPQAMRALRSGLNTPTM